MKKLGLKPVWIILLLLLILLQYQLWFQPSGILKLLTLRRQTVKEQEQNDQYRERNEALAARVKALKQSAQVVEGKAREDLGMVKKDEKFYRIVN